MSYAHEINGSIPSTLDIGVESNCGHLNPAIQSGNFDSAVRKEAERGG